MPTTASRPKSRPGAKSQAPGSAPRQAPAARGKAATAGASANKSKGVAPAAARPMTKAETCTQLGEKTGLSRKQVASVFDGLGDLIGRALGKKGPGVFVVPGLVKLKVTRKPATKARQGVNPFTKEPITIAAKPARNVVKAIPLKALKAMA